MNKRNTPEMAEKMRLRMQHDTEARRLKQQLKEFGFLYRVSFYAVVINPTNGNPEYRRIEVFYENKPSRIDVMLTREFFDSFTVYATFSIWVYNQRDKQIIQAGSWN